MGKKKYKVSSLSDSDEEKLKKLSKKERSEAVDGKPDFTDIENLRAIFETYDKVTGGDLKRFFNELKLERAFIKNLQPIETAEKFKFSIPSSDKNGDLEGYIRQYFPTIWTNQEHARWFLKWFPGFRAG